MSSGRAIKRLIDIAGSAAGLVALSPVLGTAAIAIAATMGRPVLFRHTRPGYKGRPFTMYKFRTMRPPREGEGVYFRTDGDRLTTLGRFLRATSIDELPELLNVLKGDMSLVGPRPLLTEYLAKYTPEQARRHDVRPGITGWAQVNGRQHSRFSQRLKNDVWYVDHWSLWLDAKIFALTALDVVRSRGVVSGQNVDDVDDLGLSRGVNEEPKRASGG
jgi:sugar transferase EpsL